MTKFEKLDYKIFFERMLWYLGFEVVKMDDVSSEYANKYLKVIVFDKK